MSIAKGESGFSLIELCVVLIVSGLLLAAGLQAFNTYVKQQKISDTKNDITAIQAALNEYVQTNGHYPCPAPIDATPETAGYGAAANCAVAATTGITEVAGRGGRKVRIGALPVRTLGLSESYMIDGWSRRYVYAVTQKLAVSTSATFSNSEGGITIKDASGNTVSNGAAHYALISHGPDGKGAYSSEGGLFMPCAAEAGQDQTNCDKASAVFIVTENRVSAAGANHYDDFAAYGVSVTLGSLQNILLCSAQKKFYAPGDPEADANGCVGGDGDLPRKGGGVAKKKEDTCIVVGSQRVCQRGGVGGLIYDGGPAGP